MVNLLGVPAKTFNLMFPDKALEIKRMVLDYFKELH